MINIPAIKARNALITTINMTIKNILLCPYIKPAKSETQIDVSILSAHQKLEMLQEKVGRQMKLRCRRIFAEAESL